MASKYALVVDTKRCIGCWSCAVACKLENNIPDQIWYKRVETVGGASPNTPAGTYGDCTLSYRPTGCMHCDNPACVEACPVGATWKDEETGVVMQDPETCVGCGACVQACPYQARTLLEEEPVWRVDFPVGAVNAPLEEGREPACVEGCPARALTFGDLNDPDSRASQLLSERAYETLLPDAGTNPNTYYLL